MLALLLALFCDVSFEFSCWRQWVEAFLEVTDDTNNFVKGGGSKQPVQTSTGSDVPAHPFDLILGRPTADSVTVCVLCYEDTEGSLACGTERAKLASSTPARRFKKGASGKSNESFSQLDKMGAVASCGLAHQSGKLADEYLGLAEKNVSAVVVSQTWSEVHRVNEQVRDKLKGEKPGHIKNRVCPR